MKSFFFFCTENKLSVNLNLRQFIQTRAGCCFAVALVDLCFPLFKKGKQCLKKALNTPTQLHLTFASCPLWYYPSLGSLPEVQTLYVLGCCQFHCPGWREREHWAAVPPGSAVLTIRANQFYRLPFLSWESGGRLSNNLPNIQKLDKWPKGGSACWEDP